MREPEREREYVCVCALVCMRECDRVTGSERVTDNESKHENYEKPKVQTEIIYMYSEFQFSLRVRVNYINHKVERKRERERVVFEKTKKEIDINVDTTSSTRNFGCVLIRSGVTYLPRCTIPATSRRDSRGSPVTRARSLSLQ